MRHAYLSAEAEFNDAVHADVSDNIAQIRAMADDIIEDADRIPSAPVMA